MLPALVVVISVGLVSAGAVLLWASTLQLPDFSSFNDRRVAQSTKIYDRTGEHLLYDIHSNIKRTVVSSDEISHHIKNATVAIEDAEFYEHGGIKPSAILRAVLVNLGALDFSQGGSTITQQVVKNTLLTQEKTISRKLKEWILAVKLDQALPKEEILTLYLNESPYGGNLYGVEVASQAFFDKPARDVGLVEAAYLAALPKAPTYYSPHGNNREGLETRKNVVLRRMHELSFITEEEYMEAKNTSVTFQRVSQSGIRAPHFVFYVRSYLEQKYGKDVVENGGLEVITTLDLELQERAQETVREYALRNEERFNAENASLVAINPRTGEILSMVGSRGYDDKDIDGEFNTALAKRQPGSAFKPFAYATAFRKGYTPETVIFDVKTQFETKCTPQGEPRNSSVDPEQCYTPRNYTGTFSGPRTFRESLAGSLNVPSIKVLYLAGLRDSLETAQAMGISTLTDPHQYGLTLVLGGGEVTLLDMTSAYGVFANDGVRHRPVRILEIKDGEGSVLESYESTSGDRVISEKTTRIISDILSDNEARIPTFGANSPLHFPGYDVAVKTGTTDNARDAWAVGYTDNIVVGAWAGNNNNTQMAEGSVSTTVIAPLWHDFMEDVLPEYKSGSFPSAPSPDPSLPPVLRGIWQGNESVTIDRVSGKLATEHTPAGAREEIIIPEVHSILHWVRPDDPRGAPPEDPTVRGQYELWEYGVQQWLQTQPPLPEIEVPEEYDDVHTPEAAPDVSIQSPEAGVSISVGEPVFVSIDSRGTYPLSRVDVFLDSQLIRTVSNSSNPEFAFVPAQEGVDGGAHTLRVVFEDEVYHRGELQQEIIIE